MIRTRKQDFRLETSNSHKDSRYGTLVYVDHKTVGFLPSDQMEKQSARHLRLSTIDDLHQAAEFTRNTVVDKPVRIQVLSSAVRSWLYGTGIGSTALLCSLLVPGYGLVLGCLIALGSGATCGKIAMSVQAGYSQQAKQRSDFVMAVGEALPALQNRAPDSLAGSCAWRDLAHRADEMDSEFGHTYLAVLESILEDQWAIGGSTSGGV